MSKVLGRFGQCMNIFIIAQNADVVHRKRKILKKDAPKIGAPGAAGSTSGKVKPRSTHTPACRRRTDGKDRSGIFAFGEIADSARCRLKEPPLRVRPKMFGVLNFLFFVLPDKP